MVLLLSISFSTSWATKVLLVPAESSARAADVYQKIVSTNLFDQVDLHTSNDSLPTLEKLLRYDAILYWNDYVPVSHTTFSERIVEYINSGGGFVDGICHTGDYRQLPSPYSDDYRVFQFASYKYNTGFESIIKDIPSHPILNGVNTFAATSPLQQFNVTLLSGAYTILTGSNDVPLVVARENIGNAKARRVSFNFWPVSSDIKDSQWNSSTDGARLMANALLWVAGGSIEGDKNNIIGQPDTIIYSAQENETFIKWYKKQNDEAWVEYNTTDTFLIETYDTVSEWHYMVEMLNDTVLDSTRIFTVQSKYAQTLTFNPLLEMAMTDSDQALVTSTNSDSTVTFTSSNETIATIENGKVHPVSTGTVTISAIAEENDWYWASETLTQDVTIKSLGQTISFTLVDTAYVGDADVALGATATSGLAVSYSSSDSSIATIVDNKVRFVSAGTCTIYADQVGDVTYAAAPQVNQELTVMVYKPVISDMYPVDGEVLVIDSTYELNATVTTQDAGGIDSVKVFFGPSPSMMVQESELINVVDTFMSDLSFDLSGIYYGYMVAYGANGEKTYSDTISVSVISLAPVITKTYPSQDTTFYVGDSLFIGVKATVAAGTIDTAFYFASLDGITPFTGHYLDLIAPGFWGLSGTAQGMQEFYLQFGVIANGDTSYSDYYLWTTECPEINSVTALDADGITSASFKAHWTTSPDAASYKISVWKVVEEDSIYAYENTTVNDTFFVATSLDENTTYYYNVKVVSDGGCESNISNTISLNTAMPTLLDAQRSIINVTTKPGMINISTSVESNVKIYHISGQEMIAKTIYNSESFNVNNGIYLVKLNGKVTKVVVP